SLFSRKTSDSESVAAKASASSAPCASACFTANETSSCIIVDLLSPRCIGDGVHRRLLLLAGICRSSRFLCHTGMSCLPCPRNEEPQTHSLKYYRPSSRCQALHFQ